MTQQQAVDYIHFGQTRVHDRNVMAIHDEINLSPCGLTYINCEPKRDRYGFTEADYSQEDFDPLAIMLEYSK